MAHQPSGIRIELDPSTEDICQVGIQLDAFNPAQVGYDDTKRIDVLLRNAANEIVGGTSCWAFWDWLQILNWSGRGRGKVRKMGNLRQRFTTKANDTPSVHAEGGHIRTLDKLHQ
jgi:hypothetical protein